MTLLVDGVAQRSVGPPFVVRWAMREGEHTFVAAADELSPSEPVRVQVR